MNPLFRFWKIDYCPARHLGQPRSHLKSKGQFKKSNHIGSFTKKVICLLASMVFSENLLYTCPLRCMRKHTIAHNPNPEKRKPKHQPGSQYAGKYQIRKKKCIANDMNASHAIIKRSPLMLGAHQKRTRQKNVTIVPNPKLEEHGNAHFRDRYVSIERRSN